MRNSFFLTILVTTLAGFAGCQSSGPGRAGSDTIPLLSAEAATAAGLSAKEITDANALYTVKCAKCHKFYHPIDYPQNEWDMWMRKMSRKSKLKPAQEELLTRYLAAFRSQTPTSQK